MPLTHETELFIRDQAVKKHKISMKVVNKALVRLDVIVWRIPLSVNNERVYVVKILYGNNQVYASNERRLQKGETMAEVKQRLLDFPIHLAPFMEDTSED